jgi:cell division protein FtsL
VQRFTRKRTAAPPPPAAHDPRTLSDVQAPAARPRELSTFGLVLLLIVSALVFTAYIQNIVTVDRLSVQLTEAEKQEQTLLRRREALRAEINILSSYSRIQKEATETLHLVHAAQQPYSLVVPGLTDDGAQDARPGGGR